MKQPKDYADRSWMVELDEETMKKIGFDMDGIPPKLADRLDSPEECDCIAAAIVFGAAGFIAGLAFMYLWLL